MEIKKSPKADLQNKRMLFLLFGLAVALGITGVAFSLNSKPKAGEYTPPKRETTEMEQIDNTRQDQPETPPEQQKAQAQVVTDVLNIVSNDQKIETNIVFVDDADDFDDFEMVIEDKEEDIVEEEIFFTVEEMPKFRGGGLPEFRNWVQNNVKYPQIALENGIQGNVVVQFVVGPDGKMTNFKVLQSPDKTLADATIEVLKNLEVCHLAIGTYNELHNHITLNTILKGNLRILNILLYPITELWKTTTTECRHILYSDEDFVLDNLLLLILDNHLEVAKVVSLIYEDDVCLNLLVVRYDVKHIGHHLCLSLLLLWGSLGLVLTSVVNLLHLGSLALRWLVLASHWL